jgi:hypothetical protein
MEEDGSLAALPGRAQATPAPLQDRPVIVLDTTATDSNRPKPRKDTR